MIRARALLPAALAFSVGAARAPVSWGSAETEAALLLLGVPGQEEGGYQTLLVSTNAAEPLLKIPTLVVPRKDGFVRVDMRGGALSVVPLGRAPAFARSAKHDPSCYQESRILYAGPEFVSVASSYQCVPPEYSGLAYGSDLKTLSLERLETGGGPSSVSLLEAFGPVARARLEAAARAVAVEECLPLTRDAVADTTTWAITRRSVSEKHREIEERLRWRVIALPTERFPRLCIASPTADGQFDVPDLPSTGPLAAEVGASDLALLTTMTAKADAGRAIDVILAPNGRVAAVIAERSIILVRRVGSSWRRERTIRWRQDDVVMAEWALGNHAVRWWTELLGFAEGSRRTTR